MLCDVEEHVMLSSATAFVNGLVNWRVEHDAQKSFTPRGKDLIIPAFRKHSGQMKRVFSELSPEELCGLGVMLKKVGKRAASLRRRDERLHGDSRHGVPIGATASHRKSSDWGE